eukprot:SM000189S04092  [mRNA]  locus=s189:170061:173255:+ [translate_table: standard]
MVATLPADQRQRAAAVESAKSKYSDVSGRAEEWQARGKYVDVYPVEGGLQKACDPVFGLAMGSASQAAGDCFRSFYVDEGDIGKPAVLLLHGLPSQAYSFRKVMPVLSSQFYTVAPDWLGFGFSDKPQPKYGFDYTVQEYATSLSLLVESLGLKQVSLVAQGYFALAAAQYAEANPSRVNKLIFINAPVMQQHSKLPGGLASFTTLLLGEIFAQDPLRASDRLIRECSHYEVEEDDAMVYRQPYLVSGMSGFALTAICRALRRELEGSVAKLRQTIASDAWRTKTTLIWGKKDRWLGSKGVQEFATTAGICLRELDEVGHHAQEDYGEEVGKLLLAAL